MENKAEQNVVILNVSIFRQNWINN